jgi:hypothetical protein
MISDREAMRKAISQYFIHRHPLDLRDPALLHAFETMSAQSICVDRSRGRLRHVAA